MDKNISLIWISEHMDISCESLENLLLGKVYGSIENRYVQEILDGVQ